MSARRNTGQARLYADMRRLLATLLQRDVADPRLSGMCITRVEAVHGGHQARIMVHRPNESDPRARTDCIARLNRLAPHFAHELRRAMPKRRLPALRFCWDHAIDDAADISSLLASLDTE